MPRPKNRTARDRAKPYGVATRLGPTAPATRYTYQDKRPPGDQEYEMRDADGVISTHRFDGHCHADCPDLR